MDASRVVVKSCSKNAGKFLRKYTWWRSLLGQKTFRLIFVVSLVKICKIINDKNVKKNLIYNLQHNL